MTDIPELKEYLVNFDLVLRMGAVLLDELPPKAVVRRMQATAVATYEQIGRQLKDADEVQCWTMILVTQKTIKNLRDILRKHPIPVAAAKARAEWITNVKLLLQRTEHVR